MRARRIRLATGTRPMPSPHALHALGDIKANLIHIHEIKIVNIVTARTRVRISHITTAVLRHRRPTLIENNLFIRCHTLVTVIGKYISYKIKTGIATDVAMPGLFLLSHQSGILAIRKPPPYFTREETVGITCCAFQPENLWNPQTVPDSFWLARLIQRSVGSVASSHAPEPAGWLLCLGITLFQPTFLYPREHGRHTCCAC